MSKYKYDLSEPLLNDLNEYMEDEKNIKRIKPYRVTIEFDLTSILVTLSEN